MARHMISLGAECDVAHQVRRVFRSDTAHYFDWNITPFPALTALIASDLEGAFAREALSLRADGGSVIDTSNGVSFHHSFSRDADGRVSEATIAREYAAAFEKLAFLRDRWLQTLASGDPLLFVLRHAVAQDDLEALRALLGEKAQGPVQLHCIRFHEAGDAFHDRPGLSHAKVREGASWKGDDASWDAALAPFTHHSPVH